MVFYEDVFPFQTQKPCEHLTKQFHHYSPLFSHSIIPTTRIYPHLPVLWQTLHPLSHKHHHPSDNPTQTIPFHYLPIPQLLTHSQQIHKQILIFLIPPHLNHLGQLEQGLHNSLYTTTNCLHPYNPPLLHHILPHLLGHLIPSIVSFPLPISHTSTYDLQHVFSILLN